MTSRAVFRLDASVTVGGGHAARCTALATGLRAAGWYCVFVVAPQSAATYPALAAFEIRPADAPDAISTAVGEHCSLLVVDHYGLDAAWERDAGARAEHVLVIDDLAGRPHACTHLLNPTLGFTPERYAGLVPPACELLLGPQYALLRREFSEQRRVSLERRAAARSVERLLVSIGATDPANVTGKVIAAIDRSGLGLAVDVLLGWNAPHLAALREQIAACRVPISLHVGLSRTAELLAGADLAIGTPSTAAWERCAVGLPSLTIGAAANQREVARALASAGAAIHLGDAETLSVDQVSASLRAAVLDTAALRAISAAAADICDGRGVERLMMRFVAGETKTGETVTVRYAGADDTDRLFGWQTAPGARKYARTPRAPTRPEHEAWMARTLGDPVRHLIIIETGGTPSGMLRLDQLDGGGHEISILVAPEMQGRGIAPAALRILCEIWAASELMGYVSADNVASQRAFARAGFERVAPDRFRHVPVQVTR